jgi:hypothetical protein
MLRNDVLRAIDIMALHDDSDDAQLVRVLAEAGFSKLDAEQLVSFVPLAFSRPVLERMGVTDIPESFSVMTRTGRWVEMPLSDQPVYVLAASIIGDPHMMAVMSNKTFKRLVKRCPMVNAADGLLNAGQDFSEAAMPVALSNLSAEEIGYLPWWHRLRRSLFGSKSAGEG